MENVSKEKSSGFNTNLLGFSEHNAINGNELSDSLPSNLKLSLPVILQPVKFASHSKTDQC